MAKSMKPGGGGRFAELSAKLGKRKGVTNPGALAAWIGRKKYGGAQMASWSAKARSHMPHGASMSPKGDLGMLTQAEALSTGGSQIKGATTNAVNKIKKFTPKVPGGG